MSIEFTQEDVNVRLNVKVSFIITAGLYAGPINKRMVAALVLEQLGGGPDIDPAEDFARYIDEISIFDVHLDDGTVLVDDITE